jgi:RNA polymerase sigma factor (sigma-70 family)
MEVAMRHNPDPYLYANPFVEPVSLDALMSSDYESDDETQSNDIPDRSIDTEDQFASEQTAQAVRSYLASLEPTDRTLVERVFWHDESQADVARAFGVSTAAVSKRMTRVLARGREALSDLGSAALAA